MTSPQPPIEEQVPPPEPSPESAEDLGVAELAVAALVLTMFRQWLRTTRERVMRPLRQFGTAPAPDPDEIMFTAPLWARAVDDQLMPELARLTQRGYRRSAPRGARAPSAESVMLGALRRARNLLVAIPDEVYALVNAELVASAAAGDDIYHQGRRVDRILDTTGSRNWSGRAKVIAVTEVNRAYSAGVLLGGFQAQISERRPLLKRWDSSNDTRVRDWHRAADGQIVPLGTAFDVGPDKLQYPGDPDGLPDNVIHCRCTLAIVDEGEIDGR